MANYIQYEYDGSFHGLLTVVYDVYYSHSIPLDIFISKEETTSQQSFINEYKVINTDFSKADKVNQAILNKISKEALENIYYVYLSSTKGKELIIYNYIKLGFKIGANIDAHMYTQEVSALHKIAKKVSREVMHFEGFIRFTYKNNFYYAKYEPDHNITELLAPQFADRFADQYFIIHDATRNIAAVYDTHQWVITAFDEAELLNLAPTDSQETEEASICYEKLWQEYFVNIAIKERRNESQQKKSMPKRYWKNMLETTE